jgi:hypothetical protein
MKLSQTLVVGYREENNFISTNDGEISPILQKKYLGGDKSGSACVSGRPHSEAKQFSSLWRKRIPCPATGIRARSEKGVRT